MTVFITILLAVITVALILYPYFGKQSPKTAGQKAAPVTAASTKKPKRTTAATADFNDEIEKRVRNIRETKQLFCTECGKQNRPGSKFCTYCGAKLNG